ncbi:hypothetical protein ACFX15_021627 [Malus domestica]
MGERWQAGEVRGSGLPLSKNKRGGRVLTSPRGDVTRASATGAGSVHQGSNQKKWRRKPRSLGLPDQVSGIVGDGDRPFLPQVEECGSSYSNSGRQQEGGGQSGSILAATDDVFMWVKQMNRAPKGV